MDKTISIDFDGVIHKYSKGKFDGTIYDKPMEGCFEALQELYDRGYKLVIHSCRANKPDKLKLMVNWINKEMEKSKTKFEFSVSIQKPVARCYIDDKAIRFINWKDTLNYF